MKLSKALSVEAWEGNDRRFNRAAHKSPIFLFLTTFVVLPFAAGIRLFMAGHRGDLSTSLLMIVLLMFVNIWGTLLWQYGKVRRMVLDGKLGSDDELLHTLTTTNLRVVMSFAFIGIILLGALRH